VAMLSLVLSLTIPALASAGDINRAACPNETLAGFRSYLPDCRAYEMVTPPYKDGFLVSIEAVSEDGGHLLARSLGVYSNPLATAKVSSVYDTKRTSFGWESIPMDAPPATFSKFEVELTNPALTASLWEANAPSQQPIAAMYRATSPRGPFVLVGPAGPPAAQGEGALQGEGASRDLSHSVYQVRVPGPGEQSLLWPGDGTGGEGKVSLYEYSGAGNVEPRLVGVSDEHVVAHVPESHLISACGTYLGAPEGSAYNAVSESGATVFFTALGCGGSGPPVNELFARLNGSRTVGISQPGKADCGTCELSTQADAEFQGASADGSKVFFTTVQPLLPGAAGEGPNTNLYEYDFNGPEGGRVRLLSGGDPLGARVSSVARVSQDGTHVYFTAQGVLTATANPSGRHAEQNASNLYVYERDGTYPAGHLAFVAPGGAGNAQATPDGRFLVFQSTADLTPDQGEQVEAGQVFEYDAQERSLVRVSQGQDGYNNDGNSSVYPASIPVQRFRRSFPAERFSNLAVSSDGAYVFFTTEDALTPQALSGVTSVYEYHEGHVFLISGGHDSVRILEEPAVELLGTDESGQDVFFRTADSLLPQDTDTQLDVYDARAGGGFTAPAVRPGCAGDSCRGPLASTSLQSLRPASPSAGESTPPALGETAPKPKPKPTAAARRLAAALKACRRKHDRRRRAACERQARRRYGPHPARRAAAHRGGK
jgi:hypothetical protein